MRDPLFFNIPINPPDATKWCGVEAAANGYVIHLRLPNAANEIRIAATLDVMHAILSDYFRGVMDAQHHEEEII